MSGHIISEALIMVWRLLVPEQAAPPPRRATPKTQRAPRPAGRVAPEALSFPQQLPNLTSYWNGRKAH